jgi:hypothetical protein
MLQKNIFICYSNDSTLSEGIFYYINIAQNLFYQSVWQKEKKKTFQFFFFLMEEKYIEYKQGGRFITVGRKRSNEFCSCNVNKKNIKKYQNNKWNKIEKLA